MRITTMSVRDRVDLRLDSYCKYTKNYANHNYSFDKGSDFKGWILIANILKIMRITT